MNKTKFFSAIALATACSFIIAGCSKSVTNSAVSNEESKETANDEGSSAMTATTAPVSPQPTLSNSTKTEDLKKELDDTSVGTEDFSDL